ncbi:hypothetical protein LCGC14_2329780 [marine sediment metagenome]|uniref:Uncharacterized protein n=1 Tax=marine sediment metagenome TaxID=412755 RepID=A0A0F9CF64_9ZZZZ
MIKKIEIAEIERNDTNNDGQQLVTKMGKAYQRVFIKPKGSDVRLSGFGNQTTDKWNVGETVEVIVEKNGTYWNFKIPRQEDMLIEKVAEFEKILNDMDTRIKTLEMRVIGELPR